MRLRGVSSPTSKIQTEMGGRFTNKYNAGRPLVRAVAYENEENASIHQVVPTFLDLDKSSEQAYIY
jgi:hypothetical protein